MPSSGIGFSLRVLALAAATFMFGQAAPLQAQQPQSSTVAPIGSQGAAEAVGAVRDIYIVGLHAAPLATYDGSRAGLPRAPRNSSGRIDVRSFEAQAYVRSLAQAQEQFLDSVSQALGRTVEPVSPELQFQHAFNGVVLELSESEAAQLVADARVALVERNRLETLLTDAGPELIGAPTLWDGSNAPPGRSSRGEGVVVGIIDSGANLGNDAFSATDLDGYTHANPLGAGNFLGWCNPTHPNHNAGRDLCNSKLIGGWDFADSVLTPGSPFFQAGAFEATGFEDENSHGSHVAATAAGNRRSIVFEGLPLTVSGVAPRANLVIYDACFTPAGSTQGGCFTAHTLAAINQVVADGIVDVVNFSIAGGTAPWTEAGAQAFLNATAAGVLVSASAGNSGPGASTLGHVSPWVMTVGASTHTRVFGYDFTLTAPGAPPTVGQGLALRPGGAPLPTGLPGTTPLIVSPGFANGSNDGCAAYPANTFRRPADAGGTAGIAVIRLANNTSACGSGTRRTNAAAAGAVGFLFVLDFPTALGASGNTLQMTLPQWQPIATYLQANDPTGALATASFGSTIIRSTQPADAMAAFSSRGPSPFNALKPDVTAPGFEILAAYSRWTLAGAPGSLNPAQNQRNGLLSGTSMSSPHNAGAAALVKALNRSWTPTQIKTALVTTAAGGVTKENGITASDPFDRGQGRINLNVAARAGLLLDETQSNFLAANPANGGQPQNLNLPSFQNGACVGTCTFARRARGTLATAVTWTPTITGLPAGTASVTPATFGTTSAAETPFTVSVDASAYPQGQWAFGELVLTPSDASIPVARMPIAVRPAPPALRTAPAAATVTAGQTGTLTATITNAGNPTLNWSFINGPQAQAVMNQSLPTGNGFISARFAGAAPADTGIYVADDFDLFSTTSVASLRADGFVLPGGVNLTTATAPALNFAVYADAAGVPAGAPEGVGAAPVWTFSAAANAAGINVGGNNIGLNLATAGAPPLNLAPGRYWLTVWPNMIGNGAGSTAANPIWVWRITGTGAPLALNAPKIIVPSSSANPEWVTPTTGGQPAQAMSAVVNATIQCGAPWLVPTTGSGSLGSLANAAVPVNVDATGLAAGTYRALLCVSSNGTDPAVAFATLPVTLTVLPAPTAPVASNGAASPATVDLTGSTTLSVDVAPGANPPSTALAVTADLSSIGGSATQALTLASGSTYRFTAAIPANVTPGAKTIPVSIVDAQSRTATASIALTVNAPTAIDATAAAAPANVSVTQDVTVTVEVTPGTLPASTGIAVRGDFSAIGGGNVAFANTTGNTWSMTVAVAANTLPGVKSIPVTVTEAGLLARTATATATVTVAAPNAPTAVGAAAPASLLPGATTLLTVQVASGANPASPIAGVTIDLSAFGGSASTPMLDDGNNGDATAGDGTYSLRLDLPGPTTPGPYALLATATDGLGRTAPAAIAISVGQPPAILFGNGFEPEPTR
jgi:hypothetical protein